MQIYIRAKILYLRKTESAELKVHKAQGTSCRNFSDVHRLLHTMNAEKLSLNYYIYTLNLDTRRYRGGVV